QRVFDLDGIDNAKVVVAMPGVDLSPPSPEHMEGQWRFLSVGAVVPLKRYEFLIRALAALPDRNWYCTIVGNVTRYPAYVAALNEAVRCNGLTENITLPGEVDEPALERLWQRAHVFLFSSAYEGYGMAIAEALRRGLPTVTTRAGAVADWASNGVILVRSDDPAEMAARISDIRSDRSAYFAARRRALSFGQTLPTWDESLRPAINRVVSGSL
ncbi:MAG: glycosyltransferase family 4 protein, partial [Rhizobiaceae bacterium]